MARNSLRPFVERMESSHAASADVVRELVENSALPVLILERLWTDTRRAIDRGVERTELVGALREIAGLIDQCAEAFGRLRSMTKGAGLTSHDLASFDRADANLQKMRRVLAAQLRNLDVPPVSTESTKLPEASNERQATGFVSLETFATRLRAPRDG